MKNFATQLLFNSSTELPSVDCELHCPQAMGWSVFTFLVAVTMASTQPSSGKKCPSWYVPDSNSNVSQSSTDHCKCGPELQGILRCGAIGKVSLSTMHCMTHDSLSGTVEGYCPYGTSKNSSMNEVYKELPSNVSELTDFTCGWLNRTGVLCSHCIDSLGVAVLSYNFQCARCLGKLKGWSLYLTLSLTPLTAFFFFVIIFDIDATASHMNSLLCIMQILIFSLNTNPQTFLEAGRSTSRSIMIASWTIAGFWNLDIFRYIWPTFCISQDMSTLQVLSMEYIVAMYPFVLIILCYSLIELHDNGYRLVVIPWTIVRKCFKKMKGKWSLNIQAKASMIKHFSTFLLLSYAKLLFVSYNLLAITTLHRSDGSSVNTSYVFYNASIEYLSSHHLPYFVLASVVLFIFNILPLLLLLFYPTKAFQQLLTKCRCIRWHRLHAFADKFQGCYKDGTNKTRDYRYFAGIYLLIRILYHIRVIWNTIYSIYISQIIPLFAAFLFGVLRPYRNDLYNRLDCALFILLTFGQICLATNKYVGDIPIAFLYLLAIIPLGYLFLLVVYKFSVVCAPNVTRKLKARIKRLLLKHNLLFLLESDTAGALGESELLMDNGRPELLGISPLLPPASKGSCTKTTYSSFAINH